MQLCLLITVDPWTAHAVLSRRLLGAEFCQDLSRDDCHQLVVVRVAVGSDIDAVLQQAATTIGIFNRSQQQAAAAIVEARLCPARRANNRAREPVILSDRFAVCLAGLPEVKDRDCLIMEGGQAFGSGRHPSTRLMIKGLEFLAGQAAVFPRQGLDLGCGSGILSFICLRLGAAAMLGIDISKEAVVSATRNSRLNGLEGQVSFRVAKAEELNITFDLIVANLSPSVLMRLLPILPRLSRPQTRVVLAGLQDAQSACICRQMGQGGFSGPLATFADGPWRAHLFSKRVAFRPPVGSSAFGLPRRRGGRGEQP